MWRPARGGTVAEVSTAGAVRVMSRGGLMKDVRGKVVLVTGGALGMGRLVAERFARDGATVVLWDVDASALEKAAAEFRDRGSNVFTDVVDVSDRGQVYEAAAKVRAEAGPVDVLVNNAGIIRGGLFLEVSDEEHLKTMEINFNAQMWTLKAFLGDMLARDSGHVISMSSAAGITPTPYEASYCASKAAVLHLTDTLRNEVKAIGRKGVRFTAICPSLVSTGMFVGGVPPRLTPWLQPEEMADRIYRAYHRNKTTVMEPFIVKSVPLLRALLPSQAVYLVGRLLRLNSAMKDCKGRGT